MANVDLLTQIRAVVGDDYVIDHREDLLVYEYDGSVDRSMPRAVVLPANTDEVSRVMALAYAAGVTVVGRGSGTGLSGGAITPPDGLQIAFPRMNRILDVDTVNRTALVEPGVINLDLDNHARRFRDALRARPVQPTGVQPGRQHRRERRRPPLPGLRGHHQPRHRHGGGAGRRRGRASGQRGAGSGRLRPAGRIRRFRKGTFGIATKILVRLLPLPETVRTFLGIFPDIDSACTAVSAVIGHGIVPAALEMIDALSIKAVQNVTDAGYPNDAGAVLLIEPGGPQRRGGTR